MAEINTYPLQHQLLPSKSVQTVVCRQKQNKANWIQRLFSIVTIFRNYHSNATFIALLLCLSVRKF